MEKSAIEGLAELLHARVRTINDRDPNIFARERGSTGEKPVDPSFREELRFECDNLRAKVASNGLFLRLEIRADFNLGVWSVNEPDLIFMSKVASHFSNRRSIYTAGGNLCHEAQTLIESTAFSDLLNGLDMKPRESLHFYANALVYYARSATADEFLKRSQALCRFVARIKSTDKPPAVVLPQLFSDLTDLAQRWAIADDAMREEAMEESSSEALKTLVERVEPKFPQINAYLDTHSDDESADLGSLAEAAVEARIVLQNRAGHR